jgi:formyl-CoA transferase
MTLIGQPELIDDGRFSDNRARVLNRIELDSIIADWTRGRTACELEEMLEVANIPASKVFTAADCASDPQYRHRRMVRQVEDPLFGSILHSGIVPHFPESPGEIRWTGPPVGQHTGEVLRSVLGFSEQQVTALRASGATGGT